jgi:5'-nucleotidase
LNLSSGFAKDDAMNKLLLAFALTLSGCATTQTIPLAPAKPVDIRIIGINDFHGYLDPPKASTDLPQPNGERVRIPSGGVAYLASAIDSLKAGQANNLVGASPLSSSLFLDEPSIMAMDMVGLEFNAVGNHEFDRGTDELRRLQTGGCEKYTLAEPCRIDKPFPGAKYRMLAANTFMADGKTLFPGTALKSFGSGANKVTIGFIGMTLEGTQTMVSANRIKDVRFADEADTANALVPKLKAAGADIIVVLIHEGVSNATGDINDTTCSGLSGALTGIIDRLDSRVDLVISGHTHQAYVCDYTNLNKDHPVLLTSAGSRGQIVTGIDLRFDPASRKLLSKSARNIVVQSEAFTGAKGPVPLNDSYPKFAPRADVAALVARYRDAAKAEETRIIGTLAGPATRNSGTSGESLLGNLVADAQLAATRGADDGGAQIAFMNPGGLRADVVPDPEGKVTFGAVFQAQPFANQMVVKSFTGSQIRQLLEQQFADVNYLRILSPSAGFRFGYDLSKPAGQRLLFATLHGKVIEDSSTYRVATSDFLGNGGDGFSVLKEGTNPTVGPIDLETLVAWLARSGVTPLPALDRVENITPE